MIIKHLVLSGGFTSGIAGLGSIHKLFECNILKIENIQSIYGTSVGSMIGLCICFYKLGITNDIIKDYFIQRPFHETFKINMNHLLHIYDSKGVYDKNYAFILFKPFFQTIELSTEITMKEFYDLTSIELYFYTVEVNNFVLKELSYIHTPDLSLIDAIYMSSTVPIIMVPLIKNNECYVDGGLICNYPIYESLKNNKINKDEILGITYNYNTLEKIEFINEKTNVIEYIITILNNIINMISNLLYTKQETSTYYEISIPRKFSFNSFFNPFFSEEERIILYNLGIQSANKFINSL
jgi:predicted acylesterase/phospholipase RssA